MEGATEKIAGLEKQVAKLQRQLLAERTRCSRLEQTLTRTAPSTDRSVSRSVSSSGGHTPHAATSQSAGASAELENAFEVEQEYALNKLHKQLHCLLRERRGLQQEKKQLSRKIDELNTAVTKLSQEKVDLEQSLEMEEEAFINSLMHQVAKVMSRNHSMEQAMRQHGIQITQVSQSPRFLLQRARSTPSHDGAAAPPAAAALPHGASAGRGHGHGHAPAHTGSVLRPSAVRTSTVVTAARRDASAGGSPGAHIHGLREHFAEFIQQVEGAGAGVSHRRGTRGTASASLVPPSEDSVSSGSFSMVSGFSRDPSVTRESLGASHGFPVSGTSEGGRSKP